MLQYQARRPRSKLFRLAASGLLVIEATIATSVMSEFVLTTPGWSYSDQADAQGINRNPVNIYRQASPSVVFIETEEATGSGVVIESGGLIVTNAHVVEGTQTVTVHLQNGREYQADVVATGSPDCLDLALVQIKEQVNLRTLNLATSDSVLQGQQAFAIGYPLGIASSSITQGIISNIYTEDGYIQTDAPINHGNSGGALLNDHSELIGINTKKFNDSEGMSLAISVGKIQAFVQAFKQGLVPPIGRVVMPGEHLSRELPLNGSTINASLQTGDALVCSNNSLTDLYTFEGRVGQPIMIDMTSQNIDSYLVLLDSDGRVVAESEDGGSDRSATIRGILPRNGSYVLGANSRDGREVGAYHLQATTPILVRTEQLTFGDPICFNNSTLCRDYNFQGQAGQSVTLSLESPDFRPHLLLLDAEGNKIAEEGIGEEKTTITVQLPYTGFYRVIVSTLEPAQGRFVLAVQ